MPFIETNRMEKLGKGWKTERGGNLPTSRVSPLKGQGSQMPTPRRYPTPTLQIKQDSVRRELRTSIAPLEASKQDKEIRREAECEAYAALLKEKEAACSYLTRSNDQLKSTCSKHTQELEHLRSLASTYETQLKVFFAANYEKQLAAREAQVHSLVVELEQAKAAYEREIAQLGSRLSAGESQLNELRFQLLSLLKQRSKASTFPLYDTLDKLQQDNQTLRQQLERQQGLEVTRKQFKGLEQEFRAVEQMQERVLRENGALKGKLEELGFSEQLLRAHLHKCHSFLIEAGFDLAQMQLALKCIREGTDVNPAALLTSTALETEQDLDSLDALASSLHSAKSHLSALKCLLTEAYSDLCSSRCGLQ